MSKTIKQLADELQISKTAVRKYMTDEFRQKHTETTENGTIKITAEGCKLIAETIGNHRKQIAETTENEVSTDVLTIPREVWEALQQQISIQNQTIESQRKQINDYSDRLRETSAALTQTAEALQAAQALHAGTIQKQLNAASEGEEQTETTETKKSFFARIFKK